MVHRLEVIFIVIKFFDIFIKYLPISGLSIPIELIPGHEHTEISNFFSNVYDEVIFFVASCSLRAALNQYLAVNTLSNSPPILSIIFTQITFGCDVMMAPGFL